MLPWYGQKNQKSQKKQNLAQEKVVDPEKTLFRQKLLEWALEQRAKDLQVGSVVKVAQSAKTPSPDTVSSPAVLNVTAVSNMKKSYSHAKLSLQLPPAQTAEVLKSHASLYGSVYIEKLQSGQWNVRQDYYK